MYKSFGYIMWNKTNKELIKNRGDENIKNKAGSSFLKRIRNAKTREECGVKDAVRWGMQRTRS